MAMTKKRVSKVQVEFPVSYFEKNVTFNSDKTVWAVYELESYVYDHLSEQRRIDILLNQTAFLSYLTHSFQILWLPEIHNIADHHQRLKERVRGPIKEWTLDAVDETVKYLEDYYYGSKSTNNANYRAYLLVKLPKRDESDVFERLNGFWDTTKQMVLEPKRFLETIAGLEDAEIYQHEFDAYLRKETQIFTRLSRRLKIKRGTPMTIEWLIKRNFWWGLAEPALRSTQKKPWSPKKRKGLRSKLETLLYDSREVLTLTECDVNTKHPRRIQLTQLDNGEEKQIYHTYLTVSSLPEHMDMPGNEWLYSATSLPFPVQMCVKVDVLEHRDTLKNLSKKKKDIEGQIENIQEAGDSIPRDLSEKQERADLLETETKKRKNPTFVTHVSFGLCDTDWNALKNNIKILQDHYRDNGNIHVEVPSGDQWLLFNDFLPGSPIYVADYLQRIPPETLASGMVGATQELGDNTGFYIGTTGPLHRPVYFDPRHASQINRSPSITVTGDLGGGKSVISNFLAVMNAYHGGKSLIFDPKGERGNWIEDLPELSGHVHVATLSSSEEDRGKLDPFIMLEDIESAKEAAVEILAYLSATKTNSVEYSYISQAVQRVGKKEQPYLGQCIEVLYEIGKQRDPAFMVAEILDSFKSLSFAKLLFGHPDSNTLRMDALINILQVQNLKMPSPQKSQENYSLDEKMSVALMFAMARFAHQFIFHNRNVFKYIPIDEAWAILSTEAGKSLADLIIRTGRSLFGGAILITQNATDVAGDLAGNIGVKFAFRSADTKKIKDTLFYFGMEHTPENLDLIKNLENGQCLMQDIYGRVGVLDVDVTFMHLIECFNTTPTEEQANHENSSDEDPLWEEFNQFLEEAAVGEEG